MGDRRQLFAKGRTHKHHEQHVRVGVLLARLNIKDPRGRLLRHDWREWPEGLALFDQTVDPVAHCGIARIGQDATATESARAKLHSVLEPSDDLAPVNARGDLLAQAIE